MNTISDKERADAVKSLQTKAVDELLSQANSQKPSGFVLFKNSYAVDFTNLPDVQREGNSIELGIHANMKATVFDGSALSQVIATKTLKDFDSSPVTAVGMESLTFVAATTDAKKPSDPNTVNFHLVGPVKIQWLFDAAKIKLDIAGKARKDLQTILGTYRGIEKAEVIVKPFWLTNLPSDIANITVEKP